MWIGQALLCLSVSSFARAIATFSLEGTIQDEHGTAVWGARVELMKPAEQRAIATTSASNGFFKFAQVPQGEYQIIVRMQGFQTCFAPISVPLSNHAQLKLSIVK
jgi:hypothetical protein